MSCKSQNVVNYQHQFRHNKSYSDFTLENGMDYINDYLDFPCVI